jgi:uncharacterized membrane protein/GTPase Era involved in 16S rRNA processing
MIVAQAGPWARQLLEQAWSLLEEHGRGQEVADVRRRLHEGAKGPPQVVVLGEAKKGKSMLVNALLGQAELAPTDERIATAVQVDYVPPDTELSGADALGPGWARVRFRDGGHHDVPVEEISQWVKVGGEHSDDDRGVVGATVRLSQPGAVDAIITDTPGVGGLVSGHGELALRAARVATALMFVTDAGQDFTRPESAFLARAARSVDTVVFAVTKIDKYPGSWEEIVARNRVILQEMEGARFAHATIVGVSSFGALRAAALEGDSELAEAIRASSRIGELVTVLRDTLAARSQELLVLNAARVTHTSLLMLEGELKERLQALADAPQVQARAIDRQAELAKLQERAQDLSEQLTVIANRARWRRRTATNDRLEKLERTWRSRITDLPRSQLDSDSALQSVVVQVAGEFGQVAAALLDEHLADLDAQVTELLEGIEARVGGLQLQSASFLESGSTEAEMEAPVVTTSGGIDGFVQHWLPSATLPTMFIANKVFMGAGLVTGVMNPVTPIVVGVAVAFGYMRKTKARGDAARRALIDEIRSQRMRTADAIASHGDAAWEEFQPQLRKAIRAALRARREQLEQLIAEARAAREAAPAAQRQRRQELQQPYNEVVRRRAHLESLLKSAQSGTPAASPASK